MEWPALLVPPDEQGDIEVPAIRHGAEDLVLDPDALSDAVAHDPQAAASLFGLAGLRLSECGGFWYDKGKSVEREDEAQILRRPPTADAGDVAAQDGDGANSAEGGLRPEAEWEDMVRLARTRACRFGRRLLSAVCSTVSAPLVPAGI
jgi:hypothetical protein